MARVLIICPTFDHQDTLYPTLESVRRQTFQDFEVVVIGDGAPARTAEIMADIVKQDPRFSYQWHPKHARTGEPYRDPVIRHSDCEIVAYICDDDLWMPWHLEWIVAALQTHDFAHSMDHTLHVDGHIQAILFQFASPPLRRLIAGRKTWCFGLSYGAHTRAAYLELDEGWATSPAGVATDLNMWAKFASHESFRLADILFPTALHLHSMLRLGTDVSVRANEATKILDSFSDADFLSGIFARASFSEHFRYLFESTTPRQLPGIREVFEHHRLRYQVFDKESVRPESPQPGVFYCSEQALQALDIQWRQYAGHATAAASRQALRALLTNWPGNHDARYQLAESSLASGDPAVANDLLTPFKAHDTAVKYTILRARVLLELKQYDQALALIDALLQDEPNNAYLHFHKTQALAGIGKGGRAVDSALAALAIKPDFEWAHFFLGQLLKKQGKLKNSRQHLLQAIDLGVPKGPVYIELASLETAAGNVIEAADMLAAAINNGVRHDELLVLICRQLQALGKAEEAGRLQSLVSVSQADDTH